MATNKKSVLLYCDIIHTVEKMDDETAGLFFKHYLRYINDLNPVTDNMVVDITFESVKQNLKRDLKKWEERAANSRNNGKLGGRPPKKAEPKKPTRLINNPDKPKKPVKDNVTVTVKDNVIVKDIKQIKIPAFEDFKVYALEKKKNICLDSLKLKYDSWVENGWKNGNNKKIKNWKSTLLNTLPYIKEKSSDKKESFSESVMGKDKHDKVMELLLKNEENNNQKQIS